MCIRDRASLYESEKVHVMDFNTAQKQEITGSEGDYVRVLGFVGNDLIYGFSNSGDKWIVNGLSLIHIFVVLLVII